MFLCIKDIEKSPKRKDAFLPAFLNYEILFNNFCKKLEIAAIKKEPWKYVHSTAPYSISPLRGFLSFSARFYIHRPTICLPRGVSSCTVHG